MPAMIARPPPGHPGNFGDMQQSYSGEGIGIGMGVGMVMNNTEYDTLSRSSSQSQSPTDGINGPNGSNSNEELWCDPDELLTIPIYDSVLESQADPLFPSPHNFNLMVQDYLKNLSPKKREKALLTQKMYDAVLSVLQDPKDTSTKTAQFRFWAKKMFQLTSFGGEKIVCHDHKPVAVKEQIYEVLCHCHGQAGHGGRDKTSAQVRRYYSWIPKEIIARFVRDCPFCQSRRTQSSAGFSNMSESQAFLISLQTSDTQLANKRPVSLAQARANAAALGHKPYKRPSIRTIDTSCRSRRGSAVSDDGYLQYANEMNNNNSSTGMEISSSMTNYDESNDSLFVTSPSYEFPGDIVDVNSIDPNLGSDPQNQSYFSNINDNNQYLSTQQHPMMPRRASSYHEQSSSSKQLFLDVKPFPSSESMLRRNSESNIAFDHNGHTIPIQNQNQSYMNNMIYSNPPSANPDLIGGNQFLSVPGYSGGGGGLSRTTSSSSLNSLNDDALSISGISDISYFTQNPHQIETKVDEWRENNQYNNIYPISGSTTPLDGSFSFPIPLPDIDNFDNNNNQNYNGIDIYIYPNSIDYSNSISAPPSTYMLPVPEFNFPTNLNPTNDPIKLPESNWDSLSSNTAAVEDQDQATTEAVAAVQRMFDQNNIFALGESVGMSQDQILEMHDTDLGILNLSNRSSPTDNDNCDLTFVDSKAELQLQQEHQISPKAAKEIEAELEAISILALATQPTPSAEQLQISLNSHLQQQHQHQSQYQVSEESLQHMEYVLAKAVEDVSNSGISIRQNSTSVSTPMVIIEQPSENDNQNILFSTSSDNTSYQNQLIMVEEPKCELQMNSHELNFTQWPEFTLS
ncbi:uncharacterized protein L201_002902 [Kwoniella dendrophila CBS 6074]|uniref:Integrase zinc-binding domain-containing protein n=1 Tax=Kwoniella dendrophila CBS 6074 TaxID=1295534 RepID=A0AAX4JRG2_9TREE